ncbi:MAG: protein jag [Chloroflexi bacterium]|nr:protein jag [Chloroflexota bacterium]
MVGDDVSEEEEGEPESLEAKGKNVEEAIENGLIDLEVERREVDVEVLSEGRAGLFGIGGEPARVRLTVVSYEEPAGEVVEFALDTLEELLELMDLEAEVTVRAPETPGDGLGLVKAVLDVTGEDLGVLIGRRGGTMAALQYIVNLVVSRRYKGEAPFSVDVEGYRRRREQTLEDMAFRMADRVRESGRPVTLEAMPAYERRIVHLTLSKDPTVGTASVGEGDSRKVRISVRE